MERCNNLYQERQPDGYLHIASIRHNTWGNRLEPETSILVSNLASGKSFFTCIAEETFFRGLIQQRLLQNTIFNNHRYSPLLVIILTSVLFGLLHGAAGYRYAIIACGAGVIMDGFTTDRGELKRAFWFIGF